MNSAIIYIKNDDENKLANASFLGSSLLKETLKKLKSVSLDKVYLVGSKLEKEDVIEKNSILDAINDIKGHDGKTLIVSPLCPTLKEYHYEALLKGDTDGMVISDGNELINVYMVNNKNIDSLDETKYEPLKVENVYLKSIKNNLDLADYINQEKLRINNKLLEKGVNIIDRNNTYIGSEVEIATGATIYPNVCIEGKSKIAEGVLITSGSHIIDSEIGKNTQILASRIDSSIVHEKCTIGPNSHLRMKSEVFDSVRIGNFVEFKNTKFGKDSRCAHLTYLGDSVVGEDVNIGCGVVTVNYDGAHKYATIIKDHAFVGSNSNLIAPITVGENVVVAAGSTITDSVNDDDMAIARARQIVKKGYGIKYIKKEK